MTQLDQLGIALDQGVDIESIQLGDGRRIWDIVLIERTKDEGLYFVTYKYRGTVESSTAISGYDVTSVRAR